MGRKLKPYSRFYPFLRILNGTHRYGYAGTEIIRRVVGDSKVMEVTSVTDPDIRIPMERALIKMGIFLIRERESGLNGSAVTRAFRGILA